MSNRLKIDRIYFNDDLQKVEMECPACDEKLSTTIDELKTDDHLFCKCGAVREVDIEDLFNRREVILKALRNYQDLCGNESNFSSIA